MKERIHRMVIELRWPLVVLGLAIVLASAMITASWYIEEDRARQLQQVQNRLRAAQLAFNNIKREEADFETYRNHFDTLVSRGVFGEEKRLNWVEYMNSLKTVGQIQSLNYEIASQKPVTVTTLAQTSSIEVLISRIQLKMGFKHEEHLVRTLDELRQSNAGLYRVDACTVKRKDGVLTPRAGENIVADCKLQWITMRPNASNK
ncbi:MAG TPA: hypothetical protein VM532_04550 [Burkholderiales bacterium]|nr:hypothetical protein [Burkholderiales bacterium]